MGLWSFIGERALEKAIEKKIDNAIEKKHTRSAIINNGNDCVKLIVKKRPLSAVKKFFVYNEQDEKLYTIEKEVFEKKLIVLDKNGDKLGSVRKHKSFITKTPIIDIEYKDEDLGTIQFNQITRNFSVDFNNWSIKGDFFSWSFGIYNAINKCVMQIDRLYYNNDAYAIQFLMGQPSDLGILLVAAIELTYS